MSTDEKSIHCFMTEKRLGFGEDSQPLGRHAEGLGDVVGVFDGMGGAGSTQVLDDNEKDMCSMARLASRHTSTTVDQVLSQWGKNDLSGITARLEAAVVQSLKKLAERPGGKGSEPRLRGTILHPYPTTVALAVVQPSNDEFRNRCVNVLWAGDSRIYAFDPSRLIPLQALTRDHSESGGDAALSRYASAERLELEEREFLLPPAASVIAMSDGCYGYMSHFRLMYLLMTHMVRSRYAEDWIERVKLSISKVAGDDTSFAITLGEGGFKALQEQSEARLDQLEAIAHLFETSPSNPYVLPHGDSAYYELLDSDDRRRAAVIPESPIDNVVNDGSFGHIAPEVGSVAGIIPVANAQLDTAVSSIASEMSESLPHITPNIRGD